VSSGPAFQSRYERYALIFDPTQASRLGAEALGLVERGIDPLYANDVDEVHLMALQETGRVGALVVPGALSLATLDVLIDRIAPQLWAGARSVVVVGPPDGRAALRELKDRGISWVLREPYDASEFRFVVAAALATEDKLDPRGGLRVPLTIAISVRHGTDSAEGLVRNLSIGGAYVALATPPQPGSEIHVVLPIGDRSLETDATVVYTQRPDAAGRAVREPGMGIAFRGLAEAERTNVADFIVERTNCFRL
jgi:hypothetical protein